MPLGLTTEPSRSILARSSISPGSRSFGNRRFNRVRKIFSTITNDQAWTHLRLNIFPDGGVARLRVYGKVVPDWSNLKPDELVDLVAIENGGVPLACSDMFFSSMNNLIMPGRSTNMGDGWETKRRRGPGHDWIILQLGLPGALQKIEVDTNHFKGNYPDHCSIEGCSAPGRFGRRTHRTARLDWHEILPKTKLQADTRHFFERELSPRSTAALTSG